MIWSFTAKHGSPSSQINTYTIERRRSNIEVEEMSTGMCLFRTYHWRRIGEARTPQNTDNKGLQNTSNKERSPCIPGSDCRRFIPCYSEIAKPLTDLTRKLLPEKVAWSIQCQEAFEEL